MKRIFLDADMIISAFDENPKGRTPEKIASAKQRIKEWLLSDDTTLYTDSLVKYEVLRIVSANSNTARYKKLEDFIKNLEVLEVAERDSNMAIDIWHIALDEELFKPDSRSFDILHFAVAKNNKLEMGSDNLKDMNSINRAYEKIGKSKNLSFKTHAPKINA